MNILSLTKSVVIDFVYFFNLKNNPGRLRLLVLVVVLGALAFFAFGNIGDQAEETNDLPTQVQTKSLGSLNSLNNFSLIGSVESKDQAKIQTETAGRVTAVPATLGQTVQAGTVIARLENSAQYAALLQAEGAYEAAQASANQSDISVAGAENSLVASENSALATLRNSYTTVNSAVLNDIDVFFSNQSSSVLGVRIDSNGQALSLVAQRRELDSDLTQWQNLTLTNNPQTLESDLSKAESITKKVLKLVDTFINLTANADANDSLNGSLVKSYTSGLTTERANLVGVLGGIDSARTNLQAAKDSLAQAKIAGTNESELSSANAQIKQALGSLRAAESNFQKTIITSPISGTVNELNVKTGDYLSQFSPVALVANNEALEVTVYVGETDIKNISVGQSVMIENNVPGTVTAIAPAIDSTTKKTEVKIAAETPDLRTGDTVNIVFSNDAQSTESSSNDLPVLLPITAVKFTASNGSIFVVENNKLTSVPVEVGSVRGSNVEIVSQLDPNTEFVVDVRGLSVGQTVEVMNQG